MSNIIQPLHERLKKIHFHGQIFTQRLLNKLKVKCLLCLHISYPSTQKIIETDALDIEYDGILKQVKDGKEKNCCFYF